METHEEANIEQKICRLQIQLFPQQSLKYYRINFSRIFRDEIPAMVSIIDSNILICKLTYWSKIFFDLQFRNNISESNFQYLISTQTNIQNSWMLL